MLQMKRKTEKHQKEMTAEEKVVQLEKELLDVKLTLKELLSNTN